MLASAIKEAKHVLLDQTSFLADSRAFQEVLDSLDAPASVEEPVGIKRLIEVDLGDFERTLDYWTARGREYAERG